MKLLGQAVRHISFGKGIITGLSARTITIHFSQGEKKFVYPDSFLNFLTLKDMEKQKELMRINHQKLEEKRKERMREFEKQERRRKIRTMKILPKSQAAFHIDLREAEEIIEEGTVFTGYYLSGASRGQPRIPNRLQPNSVCLLTGLPEGGTERDRRIQGAFFVKEDFLGEYCRDGIVEGHDRYRICLNEEQMLPYWDYFEHEETVPNCGRVPFKYFTNTRMQKILYDMTKLYEDTEQEELANDFYRYFCWINRLVG